MSEIEREKGQVEYLFLDMEWNRAPGINGPDGWEVIQIGAVGADEDLQKLKMFSRGIRLSDPDLFNPNTEKVTHMPVTNIMQGKPEDVVLENFAKSFPQYHYIVVWTQDTYDARQLSDGTLRCIAVLTAAMIGEEGSMVLIEELDNGIHPARVYKLIEQLIAIGKKRNIYKSSR